LRSFDEGIELAGDRALDGVRRHFLLDAFLFQELIE
jgi:hypothetical protein